MSHTLWISSFRYLFSHPWQVLLAILGVSLGVAVVVAMDLASQSAQRSFKLSSDTVEGKATHVILGGPAGLPEEVYRKLRVDAGIRTIAPVVEGYGYLTTGTDQNGSSISNRPFQLLGVDPFAEASFRPYLSAGASPDIEALITDPGAVLISAEAALSLGVTQNDQLEFTVGGVRHQLRVVGILEPEDGLSKEGLSNLVVADIATAQEVLGDMGRLSRIDVALPEGDAGIEILDRIQAVLPQGATIERASARSESAAQLTRAFQLNLTALSLLALLVGTFLIYNTISFSVVRRRPQIGTLRALGVTRREIVTLFLGEAAVIGLVSSVIGVLLGILAGLALVDVVTRTINDIYYVVSVRQLAIPASVLIKGGTLGIVATLAAAALPAWEASSVSSRSAMTRSHLETRLHRGIPRFGLIGLLLLGIGAVVLVVSSQSLLASFAGLFAIFLGLAMLVPQVTLLFLQALSRLPHAALRVTGSVAVRATAGTLSRTAIAITALAVAVSITIGIGTMVHSFRGTVERWLGSSLVADIYLSPSSAQSTGATITPAVLHRLVNAEGIDRVTTFRTAEVRSSLGDVQLVALGTDFPTFNRPKRFKVGNPAEIWQGFQDGDTVFISEPFAYHYSLDTGSNIGLQTEQGMREFRVAGIYFDYSSSRGVVMVSRAAYQRFWNDYGVSSLGIYLSPGANINTVIDRLYSLAGRDQELEIRSNVDLRRESLEIFDRSFTVTSVMRVLAMIVAFVGVLSALMALQLERGKEIGALRAIGFTRWQVWRLITAQTGLMGLLSGLISVPIGLALAAALVFVVNRRSFGWSMDLQIFPLVLLEAIILAVAAALLAGMYPAVRMAMCSPAEALREE